MSKAADGGDAPFTHGLSQLFGASRSEPLSTNDYSRQTDDECDNVPSPLSPLVRQAHPVVDDLGAPYSGWAYANRESVLQYEDVQLVIPAGAVLQDTRITIRTIPARIAGAPNEGMTNVVPGERAVRLGPHGLFFQKPITLILPFDRKLIPGGMTEEDLATLYFDTEAGEWRQIRVLEVRAGDGVVVAETEHFTDFVNATLAIPDHPAATSFDQSTVANVKLGDPSTGLELVSPPGASSDGAAHLTYRFNIPPGRRGMQPDLNLTYSSDAGNGWMGLGWNIHVSRIRVDTRFGVPRYNVR